MSGAAEVAVDAPEAEIDAEAEADVDGDIEVDEVAADVVVELAVERVRETISLRIEVPRECDGWRLDHFLKRRIGRLSRTRIQDIIATQVTLSDGRRPRSSASRKARCRSIRRPPRSTASRSSRRSRTSPISR